MTVSPGQSLTVSPFTLPRNPFDISPFTAEGDKETYHFPATFVLALPMGRVLERDGVVLTPENCLLADTAVHFGRPINEHRLFSHDSLPAVTTADKSVAVLASVDSHVYFHWMCNVLPRLSLLQRAGISYDQFYLPPLTRPFQEQSLRHLGIDLQTAVFGNPGVHLQATTLVVPSLPAAPCDCPPWVCDFLRERFLPATLPQPTRRLYISRARAQRRRVVNESEVMALLTTRGFESVELEDLDVVGQASLFASAEAIVAPHGAGLTNLVFCSRGTKVLELFHPSWICDCYWQVSAHLGLRHEVAVARRGFRNFINRLNDRNRDTRIDISDLKKRLAALTID